MENDESFINPWKKDQTSNNICKNGQIFESFWVKWARNEYQNVFSIPVTEVRKQFDIFSQRAVKHRILNFDLTSLKGKYVTVKRAKALCRDQTLAEIEAVSVGAAVFFSWCMVTIDAFEMLT